MLDHRGTQGLDDETIRRMGLPHRAGVGLFEAPTVTCNHCKTVVVLNPLRNRDRAYCRGCDHYLCDPCGAARAANGNECRSFDHICEEIQQAAVRSEHKIII